MNQKNDGIEVRGVSTGRESPDLDNNRFIATRLICGSLFAVVSAVSGCRSDGAETSTEVSEVQRGSPEDSALAHRLAACEALLAQAVPDALQACLSGSFEYSDNVGNAFGEVVGFRIAAESLAERVSSLKWRSEYVVVDGDRAFSLWFASGTASGSMFGESISGASFGIFGASFVEGHDNGHFEKVRSYLDPNMLHHQIGKAPRSAHEVVASSSRAPRVLVRNDASSREALDVVRTRVAATNAQDLEALAATYADDVVGIVSSNATDARSKAGVLAGIPQAWSTYPDLRVDVKELWGAGDIVVLEGIVRGTNHGDLGSGVAPTGKSFALPFVELIEVTNGKVTRFYRVADSLGIATQIGLIDPPKSVLDPPAPG